MTNVIDDIPEPTDAVVDSETAQRIAVMIASAPPVEGSPTASLAPELPQPAEGAPRDSGRQRRSNATALLSLTDRADFWHDPNRTAYASIPIGDHVEHWPIRSRDFQIWLSGEFYIRTGGAVSNQAFDEASRILEAKAVNDGAKHASFVRVGRFSDRIYIDLTDASWRAIEICSNGWRVVSDPPVKFVRTPAMRALPAPEAGESIDALRRFVNVRSDDDFMLIVAWLVAGLKNRGPYPILAVNGEQGTGKSVFCRLLRSLIDPSSVPIRAVPKDDRDLIVSAGNCHVLAFDNLSSVPAWLSDALCRLATGGGFTTRKLHTDSDEMIFEAARPILLNGIPALTDRADLADRALTIHLAPIAEESRRPEDEFEAEFESVRPFILGALCDAVAGALRHLPNVRLKRSPRMADFVKWISAASPGLGWEAESFMRAYRDNRRDVSEGAFEADPVAVAIRDHAAAVHPDRPWTGTPTELLSALDARVPDSIRRSRLWPLTAQSLGGRIDRAAPLLRQKGFLVSRRHSGVRTITIVPPGVTPLADDDRRAPVGSSDDVVPL
ncbi:MAG: hypothetical protein K8F62_14460 [Pseudorhodoplanes sp.]|nr:hypothetical protein [Pseudorhodoplanes sp.]